MGSREETVYEDFRFLTTSQVQQLGAENLIGSNLLKAHLHGFLIDNRLYSMTEELEESREETVYEDFRFLTTSQVQQLGADPCSSKKSKKAAEAAQAVLEDDRFSK